ncbi:hypothetical protein ASG43_02665 [Aureimonas sp. Leaf454]|uniref:hypothetical protein n=1 Tax=Aureimonas sp. Leaf454 TaxID=1736381 RepID=UPI0007003D1C|nr:hypothetical protein [Aureimonas sp. Leaf454]KQT54513.1 hypothetical protein ASG43_02665 [Aureimonas sp. Leaf454]
METRLVDSVTPSFVNTLYDRFNDGSVYWNGLSAPRNTPGLYYLSTDVTIGYINSKTDTDIYKIPVGFGANDLRGGYKDLYFAAELWSGGDVVSLNTRGFNSGVDIQIMTPYSYNSDPARTISANTEIALPNNDPFYDRAVALSRPNDGIDVFAVAYAPTGAAGENWVSISAASIPGAASPIRKYAIADTPDEAFNAVKFFEPLALRAVEGSPAGNPVGGPSEFGDVFRFYNKANGTHFYTASVVERNNIQQSMPDFVYEGNAFDTNATAANGAPVYRFLNKDTGVYFYTIKTAERDSIISNLKNYQFEGEAYKAYTTAGAGREELHRFFNTQTGAHFYTAEDAEQQQIIRTLPQMRYEGIAYYVELD